MGSKFYNGQDGWEQDWRKRLKSYGDNQNKQREDRAYQALKNTSDGVDTERGKRSRGAGATGEQSLKRDRDQRKDGEFIKKVG